MCGNLSLAPSVEEVMVSRIERAFGWFELQLADSTPVRTRKVIVATGMEYAAHIPPELAHLPPELLTAHV